MSLKLPNYQTAPPGQWRYTVPETGQTFGPLPDLDALTTALRAHYTANGYPIPDDLRLLIEQQMCSSKQLTGYCVEEDGRTAATAAEPRVTFGKAVKVTFHTVSTGTKRLLGINTSVSQEQADRRAATCITCTENVDRENCAGCRVAMLRDLVVKIIGSRKTVCDSNLKVCRVCLCENRAKVWLPLAEIDKLTTPEEREKLPPHCWQRTERHS